MDPGLNHYHNQRQQHPQQQQQNMNSGLTRYRSAPSSYFSNLINSGMYEDEDIDPFFNTRVSSPETERILSRLMSDGGGGDNPSSRHNNLGQIRGNELQFMDSMKQELTFSSQLQEQQRMMYQNHTQSHEVVHNNINSVVSSSSSTIVNDRLMANGAPTNLLRQSSSPAGFFKHINTEDSSISSANRSKRGMASSSGSHSSSRLLSRIPENDGKTMAHNNGDYVFPGGSWEESAMLTDRFLNEFGESGPLSTSENQGDEGRIHAPTGLTHQLSLPTSSTELSLTEKLLQFHDSVPLRSRAKRGCATHPRSIAERVRRTRISERMKRLQDLVPNMDKQTSTADMLDLAVDYIKQLQNHVETLTDHRKKCTCPRNQEL